VQIDFSSLVVGTVKAVVASVYCSVAKYRCWKCIQNLRSRPVIKQLTVARVQKFCACGGKKVFVIVLTSSQNCSPF